MSTQPETTTDVIPEGHIRIEIDGKPLVVPKNSMIIQAADKAGIPIPRFCYHDKLAIAANCRMCLVEVEKMPKPAPACATPVMDGMKIQTRSEKSLKSQRNVMEFLLINHPLDCPVCDQGGECELQDVSLGYGRSVSRFNEGKRVVPDEDMGPLVATEMTRCIQCTRCIRFTGEIAGTYELGGMSRGQNLQIGTFDGKPLTTELSGNVIDVCPVGALTNKVFQFRARPWELMAKESLGYHDAMGSNLFLHVRRGEVLRTVPRDNEAVNECWLSDRDRYSHQGLYSQDRATQPLQKVNGEWQEISWEAALVAAADLLQQNKGDNLGVLVHPSTSNEEGVLLAQFAEGLGTGNLDHRIGQRDFSDAAIAQPFGLPLADIEDADVIVVLGSHIRHELPLLHQRIRKAQQKRHAQVHVINPVDFDFTFGIANKQIVKPSEMASALHQSTLVDAVKNAKKAVIIVGHIAESHPQAASLRDAATTFASTHGAALCRIPQGANAVGLSQVGVLPQKRDVAAMLQEPRSAYVLYGIEPGLDFADTASALAALNAAKVVAFSQFACASTRQVADLILPIGALPEISATLTNLNKQHQTASAGGKLPAQAREGWRVLRALAGQLQLPGFEFTDFAGVQSLLHKALAKEYPSKAAVASKALSNQEAPFELAATAAIYRTDAVVRRASALQAHPLNDSAAVVIHPSDASALDITANTMVKVHASAGTATLPVRLDQKVAQGAVWIETGHGATAPLGAGRVKVVKA